MPIYTAPSHSPLPTPSLGQIASLFLGLGSLGFAGPQAHLAMMHEETVVRRQWLRVQGVAICGCRDRCRRRWASIRAIAKRESWEGWWLG
ncbi:MAG: hypothetical protein Q6K99_02120 [Thermostichales cyanobacterium BF4_bins_65]